MGQESLDIDPLALSQKGVIMNRISNLKAKLNENVGTCLTLINGHHTLLRT